jgi:hypothetical protein
MRTLLGTIVLVLAALSGGLVSARPVAALGLLPSPDQYSVKHDTTLVIPAPGVLVNDIGLLGSSATLAASASHGVLHLNSNGGFTYQPNAGYVGSDSFRYRIGLLGTATVTITVTNVAPVAKPDSYSFAAGRTLAVPAPGVLANDLDADGDTLSASEVGGISGSLDLRPDGSFTYSPNGGFSGSASFTYRVSDGLSSSTTTVTLTAIAATPAPTASPVPTPTPRPTPTPTPRPTATPILSLPLLPLPSLPLPSIAVPPIAISSLPLPSLTPIGPFPTPSVPTPMSPPILPVSASAAPNAASGSPGPSPSERPDARSSGSPAVSAGGGGDEGGAGGGPLGDPSISEQPVVIGPDGVGVRWSPSSDGAGFGALSLDGLELGQLWLVPAALVGTPGLLVILWVVLQLVAGAVWLPAARRLRGDDGPRAQVIVRA